MGMLNLEPSVSTVTVIVLGPVTDLPLQPSCHSPGGTHTELFFGRRMAVVSPSSGATSEELRWMYCVGSLASGCSGQIRSARAVSGKPAVCVVRPMAMSEGASL